MTVASCSVCVCSTCSWHLARTKLTIRSTEACGDFATRNGDEEKHDKNKPFLKAFYDLLRFFSPLFSIYTLFLVRSAFSLKGVGEKAYQLLLLKGFRSLREKEMLLFFSLPLFFARFSRSDLFPFFFFQARFQKSFFFVGLPFPLVTLPAFSSMHLHLCDHSSIALVLIKLGG